MKKDIVVIRESITKVVSLLTRQAIRVTQRGTQAYVQYSTKNGAIEAVNLPYIPDDATEEFIAAVQGFLDHEVGHVLFTDAATVVKAKKAGARVKNLHNLLEDVYIERKMTEAFRGAVNNLESVRKFHVNKMAYPKIVEALSAGNKELATGYVAAIQFRAWGGQLTAQDFLKDNPAFAQLVEPLAKSIGPELIARITKLKSSDDCLKLAVEIVKKTAPPPPPPPPPTPPSPDPKKGEGEPAPSDSAGEPDDSEPDSSEPEDEGTTKTEADDSGKERDESSKTEEEGAGAGGVDGDDEAKPDDGEDEEPKSDRDEGETGDTPADGAGSSDEGEGGDEPPTEDDPTGADGDSGEGSEKEGEEGKDDGEASGEEGAGAEDDSGGKSDTSGSIVDDTSGDTTDDDSDGADEGVVFDTEHDFDKEASSVLSDAAKTAMRSAEYKVFSTDWDKVYEAPMAVRSDSVERMVDRVQHMVAGIQKQLERAMAAKDKKTWNPGQRRGRISPGALFRSATGDDRVFRKRHETRAKNTAVSLLVDCSGSMSCGDRIGIAGLAAYALSSTLERLKITHEVLGYTTAKVTDMSRAAATETGIQYSRSQALRIPVFKAFHEGVHSDAKSRLAHLTEHPQWLKENVDGESLQIAARRLLTQRAERHVLIVLSDGEPACPGDYYALHKHLSKVTADLEAKGVEVVGIGIQTDAVKDFYRRSLVLNNLNELPTTLVGQLTKILLAP